MVVPIKYSYEKLVDIFKREDFLLLTKKEDYKNYNSELLIKCPNNHDWKLKIAYWNQGYRCPQCKRKQINLNILESLNFKIIKNTPKEKMSIKCERDHHLFFNNFTNTPKKCKQCQIEDIIKDIHSEYKIISDIKKIKKIEDILEIECSNNHRYFTSLKNWIHSKNRCPHCNISKKKEIEFIKNEFKKEGYILLTEKYKNSYQKLDYICPKEHKHFISWSDWRNGSRCFYCRGTPKKSKDDLINGMNLKLLGVIGTTVNLDVQTVIKVV